MLFMARFPADNKHVRHAVAAASMEASRHWPAGKGRLGENGHNAMTTTSLSSTFDVEARVAAVDWQRVTTHTHAQGWAVIDRLLSPPDCVALAALYGDDGRFRKRVVMEHHGYGQGEYKYFDNPLPEPIRALRTSLYPHLAPLANRWTAMMELDIRYPETHDAFIARCHDAGQLLPTPLILRYRAGDYNRLHQDLYGEHVFPLQVVILLSQPGDDFTGGEFVLTEQRPRMQSRTTVVPLNQGDAVVFAVHHRPVRGRRGHVRVTQRHGVSTVLSGERLTAGIIFHDAT